MFSHTYVHHRTTKINKRAAKNPYLAHTNDRPEESLYDDPRIKIRSRAKRRKGGLSFHREGRFVKEAELLRAKTLNEAYADRDARRHFNQASSAQRGTGEVAADAAAAAARPAKGALVADPGLPEPPALSQRRRLRAIRGSSIVRAHARQRSQHREEEEEGPQKPA